MGTVSAKLIGRHAQKRVGSGYWELAPQCHISTTTAGTARLDVIHAQHDAAHETTRHTQEMPKCRRCCTTSTGSLAAEGVNLAREYPQWFFLQIMHPRTLHIKNPGDAKLASLSILRKWPVSMATIVKNRKIQKVQYLSTYSSYFHNISF